MLELRREAGRIRHFGSEYDLAWGTLRCLRPLSRVVGYRGYRLTCAIDQAFPMPNSARVDSRQFQLDAFQEELSERLERELNRMREQALSQVRTCVQAFT